jgi:predicted outer membrane repeat protein
MIRSTVLDTLRAYRRQWWRFALTELLVALAVGGVIAVLAILTQLGFGASSAATTTSAGLVDPVAVLVASALIPVAFAVTGVPALMASITTIVSITDDSLAGRRVRLFRSLAIGFASAYRMTWTVLFAVVTVALLFVVSPVLIVLGAAGLILTPLVRLAARRFAGLDRRWPSVRTLVWCVVPFGVAFRRLAQALLSVPAVILESASPVGANRAASAAVRSRRLLVLVAGFVALLVAGALEVGALSLGAVVGGNTGAQVGQGLVQLITLGLPIVALTVVYRRIAEERDHPLNPQRVVRRRQSASVAWPVWVRRTAIIMPGVLVLAGLSVVPLSASSASAATPGVSASYVVNTGVDDIDSTTLAAEQQACVSGTGNCTFRAAVAQAQATALGNPDGTVGSMAIKFSKDMTIALNPSGPPTFAVTGSGGSGTLSIDGRGHKVTIDGQGAVQGLKLSASYWGFELRGLQFNNGYAPSGTGNTSQGGALNIYSDDPSTTSIIDGLTFSGNKAVGGGAVFTKDTVTIENSTFVGNSLLAADNVVSPGGADIYGAGDSTTAKNDTFSNSTGGAILGVHSFTLSNALISENDIAHPQCTGVTSGSHNIIHTDDHTCLGGAVTTGIYGTQSMLDALTRPDGYPSVFPLLINSNDPALGAGTDCPATDERGVARSTATCDAGAYEFNRTTQVTVGSDHNPSSIGTDVIFTATVTSSTESGSVSSGTVRFSIDGTPVGSAVPVQDGVAQYTASGLAADTHPVIAVYSPADGTPYTQATSAALQQKVDRATGPVGLSASVSQALRGASVTFTVTAGDRVFPATGTFELRDVSSGTPGVVVASGVQAGSDGTATVDIDSLDAGEHKLVASYSGDAQNAPGTSSVVTVTVVAPTTTTLTVDHLASVYGAPVVVTAHVTGATSGVVSFGYGSTDVTATVDSNGDASATISDLPVRASAITAYFAGSGVYQNSTSDPSTVTVTAASTSTTLSTGQTGDLGYGVPVTLVATVTNTGSRSTADPAGQVAFTVGGTAIGVGTLVSNSNGTATASYVTTLGQLPLGDVSIVATYTVGSGFVGSASNAVSRSVVAATTTVSLTSDGADASVGHDVRLSATVTTDGSAAKPTGSIVFSEGSTTLGTVPLVDGTATLGIATLARGTHTITATFSGNTKTRESSGTFAQTISQASTRTTLTPSATSIVFGQSVNFEIAVTASGGAHPDGTLVLKDGDHTLATLVVTGGAASTTLSVLAAGSHALTAEFVGDDDFLASTGESDVTVNPAATTTTLQQSATSLVYGNPLVLTATVTNSTGSGGAPAGSVQFLADGNIVATVPVVEGATAGSATAAFTTSTLAASLGGSDTILSAVFVPSDDFVASLSATSHVTITAAATTTTLVLSAGSTTSAVTATATVAATSGQGVPSGTVTFTYKSDETESVPLVDGVATLSGLYLPQGSQDITANYLPDTANFVTGAAAGRSVAIGAGAPDVTITDSAGSDFAYGTPDTLTALVAANSAGPAPTGDVSFTAFDASGTPTLLGSAALTSYGAAGYGYASRAELTTISIPVGTTRIVAMYSGDGTYYLGTSVAFDRSVSTVATTATIASAWGEPAWVGAEGEYYVTMTSATDATPTGTVALTVDGVAYSSQPLTAGRTSFHVGVETLGTHHVSATFTPSNSDFGASDATLDHAVVKLPTTVALTATPMLLGVGEPVTVTATLTPPAGYASYTAAPAGGYVVVTDGMQTICTIYLEPGGPTTGDETASCSPRFDHAGSHVLVAAYEGDTDYQASVSGGAWVTVLKKTATMDLSAPSTDWVGGDTVTLSWNITGPKSDDAPVTLTYGDTTVCTSTAREGSCDYTFPFNANGAASFLLSYAGDSDWGAATTTLDRTVTGCIPASAPTADPSLGGSVGVATFVNCGAGDGYLVGTTVSYVAKASDGYELRGWSTDKTSTSTTTSFVVQPSMKTVTDTALFAASCVTVTVAITSRDVAGGEVRSSPEPNCGGVTQSWSLTARGSTTVYGSFEAGTKLSLTAVPPATKDERAQDFYGWSGLPEGSDTVSATTSFTLEPATNYRVGATFDSACYDVIFPAPDGGTASIGTGDCYTPAGVAGYRAGSTVPVATKASGSGYFIRWNNPEVTSITSTVTESSGLLKITQDHLHVGASYGICYHAPTVVRGMPKYTTGTLNSEYSTATATPAGNCPSQGVGWYLPGTEVHLIANSGSYYGGLWTFSGWTGLPLNGLPSFEDTGATVNSDGEFVATYYNANNCVPLNLVSKPAGAFKITTDAPTSTCPSGQWDMTVARDGYGNIMSTDVDIVATPLTDAAKTALGVMGVDTMQSDREGFSRDHSIPPSPSLQRVVKILGATTITVSACEAIDAKVTLISPNGTAHTEQNPGDADFIDVAPTPNCGYGQTYYTVGNPVFTQANAPADGYSFVGWTGAITSTDPDPVTPVKIDGAASSTSITATYKVKCYTLSSNWDGVSAFPAPNCPDTDASAHAYIGGTSVALMTTGISDKIFRGWTGKPDSTSGDTAIALMKADQGVYANYTSPSVGEKITAAFTDMGDGIAMVAKKAVGVVSAAVTALVLDSNPVTAVVSLVAAVASGISALLHAVGVNGSALDGFDNGLSYVTGMLNFITATSNCATVWSYGASDATPLTTGVGGAVGSGIVMEMEAQQEAQQAAIHAAYDAPSLIPGISESTATAAKVNVGRLATVATVGVSIYTEISNSSWTEDAATAWTGGGDAYLRCISASIPPYMGVPPLPPGN